MGQLNIFCQFDKVHELPQIIILNIMNASPCEGKLYQYQWFFGDLSEVFFSWFQVSWHCLSGFILFVIPGHGWRLVISNGVCMCECGPFSCFGAQVETHSHTNVLSPAFDLWWIAESHFPDSGQHAQVQRYLITRSPENVILPHCAWYYPAVRRPRGVKCSGTYSEAARIC